MTLVELIKDFIDTGKERVKTPLSGAFLWAFIIFNWRPILFLLFSKESIENKIIVINYEYCTFGALGWPLMVALFYTLVVPRIMLLIDKNLAKTRDERITESSKARQHKLIEKKEEARVEYELKNIESGSQTIDELNAQIDGLKDSNKTLSDTILQLNEVHKVNIKELQDGLRLAQERTYNKSGIKPGPRSFANLEIQDKIKIFIDNIQASMNTKLRAYRIVDNLTRAEIDCIKNLDIVNKKIGAIMSDEMELINSLVTKKVLIEEDNDGTINFYITAAGNVIRTVLKEYLDK